MRLVRFGSTVINMDLVSNIRFWQDQIADLWVAASGNEGQSRVRLQGGDTIALEHWLADNCENARAPMEVEG